jgi:hypothetical protein
MAEIRPKLGARASKERIFQPDPVWQLAPGDTIYLTKLKSHSKEKLIFSTETFQSFFSRWHLVLSYIVT